MIAAQNAKVTGDGLRSRVAFWSFADEYSKITGDKRDKGLYNYTPADGQLRAGEAGGQRGEELFRNLLSFVPSGSV